MNILIVSGNDEKNNLSGNLQMQSALDDNSKCGLEIETKSW